MIPFEILEELFYATADVIYISGAAFMVLVGIAAFKYMRRAVGGSGGSTWVDSKGNEYATEADAVEADSRSSNSYTDQDFDAQWAELQASKGENFVDHHAPIDQQAIDRANDDFH